MAEPRVVATPAARLGAARDLILRTGQSGLALARCRLLDLSDAVPAVHLLHQHLPPAARERLLFEMHGLEVASAQAGIAAARAARSDTESLLLLTMAPSHLDTPAVGIVTDHVAFRRIVALTGQRPPLLSANMLAVDPEARLVALHRRSPRSDVAPGRLHVIGGAHDPLADEGCLNRTAEREAREESGGTLIVATRGCLTLLQHEVASNYRMLTFLGVPATAHPSPPGTVEGEVVWHELDALPGLVAGGEADGREGGGWVPTGLQSLLVWLALGAPVGPVDAIRYPFDAAATADVYRRCRAAMTG